MKAVQMGLIAALVLAPVAASAQTATPEITRASWGYAGDRKDVTKDVAQLCAGKAACEFAAANDSFTGAEPKDPSPGNAKGLLVTWKCGATERKNQFAEGRQAKIACP